MAELQETTPTKRHEEEKFSFTDIHGSQVNLIESILNNHASRTSLQIYKSEQEQGYSPQPNSGYSSHRSAREALHSVQSMNAKSDDGKNSQKYVLEQENSEMNMISRPDLGVSNEDELPLKSERSVHSENTVPT